VLQSKKGKENYWLRTNYKSIEQNWLRNERIQITQSSVTE